MAGLFRIVDLFTPANGGAYRRMIFYRHDGIINQRFIRGECQSGNAIRFAQNFEPEVVKNLARPRILFRLTVIYKQRRLARSRGTCESDRTQSHARRACFARGN